MREKIIHTECDCLWADGVFDDNCRKRWFDVTDIENGKHIYIGVCNQHLGILINKRKMEEDVFYLSDYRSYWYESVVRDVISNYINVGNYGFVEANTNDISNKHITFTICVKPHIVRSINILDCIEMYLNGTYNYALKQKLLNTIKNYLTDSNIYKKYKTKYKECLVLLNRLDKKITFNKDEILNQIFINILEMNARTPNHLKTSVKTNFYKGNKQKRKMKRI